MCSDKIMSKYLTITILAILLVLLVLPQVASAARFPFEGPLVPCGRCEEWECVKREKKCPEGGDTCNEEDKVDVCVERNYDVCVKPDPATHPEVQPCNLCHFFVLAQNIIYSFITIILAIGTIMIGIGGFIILTSGGVPEKASHGKRVITYTIIGLLVAFMSWMLINQTMLLLVGQGRGEKEVMPWPWDKVECIKYLPTGEGASGEPIEDEYYISELL